MKLPGNHTEMTQLQKISDLMPKLAAFFAFERRLKICFMQGSVEDIPGNQIHYNTNHSI